MTTTIFPPLPLAEWEETKTTLHLFLQIVGKVRLGLNPRMNHWWHVPYYVSPRGLTTAAIPYGGAIFEMEFDLCEHQLVIRTSGAGPSGVGPSGAETRNIALGGKSVADFYGEVRGALSDLGISARIIPKPFDPARVKSEIPFAKDQSHTIYVPEDAHRFFRIISGIEPIFREFRGRFLGKCSPVHFFWHSFDLAVTRFSGRTGPKLKKADPVTQDAYSHEVISAGFWVGDDNLPEPAFYTYVYPEPKGLGKRKLLPENASWVTQETGTMAILTYENFRTAEDPRAALLDFCQSAYKAGAKLAKWPRKKLEA